MFAAAVARIRFSLSRIHFRSVIGRKCVCKCRRRARAPFGSDSVFGCLPAALRSARRGTNGVGDVHAPQTSASVAERIRAQTHHCIRATCRLQMKIIWQRLDSRSEAIESIQADRGETHPKRTEMTKRRQIRSSDRLGVI